MFKIRKMLISLLLLISGSHILKNLKEIKKIEKKKLYELKKYQEAELKKILMHSYKNVPYYSNILKKSNVINDDLEVNLNNFDKIPVLTKGIIRKEFKNLQNTKRSKYKTYINTSGGSTGEPIKIVQDSYYSDWNIANKIYYKTFAGQEIGDREVRLWGSDADLLLGKENLLIRLRNKLYNRKEFNFFKVSESSMKSYVKEWNKFKPQWVEAYVQSIFEFAKYIKKNNIEIHKPKGILTSAGVLYDEMKEVIYSVFECKIFNRYGSREVGDMACSCGYSDKLHLSMWNHYIEILDDKLKSVKNGEYGKIYVTGLRNYSMPLIRYEIGDVGVRSIDNSCPCKREVLKIDKIKGREVEIFKTKKGELIDGEAFTHLMFFRNWVKKFQIIQKTYDLIEVNIELNNGYEIVEKEKKEIENKIKKIMNNECEVIWNFTSDIKPTKSGKYVYTVSNV